MVENLNTNELVGPELLQDSGSGHVTPTEPPTITDGFDGNKPLMGCVEFTMEYINGIGYHIFEGYATNRNADVGDYERYEYIGRGMGGLSLIKEGTQILLDSKYKNLDSCMRNSTVRMKVSRLRFTPSQFGYDKSLEKIAD